MNSLRLKVVAHKPEKLKAAGEAVFGQRYHLGLLDLLSSFLFLFFR